MPSATSTSVLQPTSRLPDYARPPVIETILSVQFDPLPKLKNSHLGLFWSTLNRSAWPTIEEVHCVEPQFERFAEAVGWGIPEVQIQVMKELPVRLQIKNPDGDRLIQVQNGRLIFNWLGISGATYPHYQHVRKGFIGSFTAFQDFVRAESLGDVRLNQWEVTYLNHIPRGTVWQTPADWHFFTPLGGVPTIEGLIEGESFAGEWHFVIPGNRGRLHANWQHRKRKDPKKGQEEPIIVLNLTARGPLTHEDEGLSETLSGLDLGHETIVNSFRDLMSKEANDYWGLKHAENEGS